MKKFGTKKGKNQHFWVKPRGGTGTKTRWYRYPLKKNPFGTDTKTSGTGTNLQNVFGTVTKHSGTGTTVSKSLDFCNFT